MNEQKSVKRSLIALASGMSKGVRPSVTNRVSAITSKY